MISGSGRNSSRSKLVRTGFASGRAGRWLCVVGLLLVLAPTLFPYDFFPGELLAAHVRDYARRPALRLGGLLDPLLNIALFIPLGAGVAAATHAAGRRHPVRAGALAALSISTAVEAAQFLLPTRQTSIVDLLANTLGGLAGAAWAQPLSRSVARTWKWWVHARGARRGVWLSAALAYTAAAVALASSQRFAGRAWGLAGWDDAMPLVIGNEADGSRPWRGAIRGLCFADRSLSRKAAIDVLESRTGCASVPSLAAWYPLTGAAPYRDRIGGLPALSWRGGGCGPHAGAAASVDRRCWLETPVPPKQLVDRLRASSRFAALLTLSTHDTAQWGPARIVSLSFDPERRNLTLAQWGHHLVLRVRSRVGRSNGANPEFVFPNALADTLTHRVVVSYDSTKLAVYIDRPMRQRVARLGAASGLVWLMAPPNGAVVRLGGVAFASLPLIASVLLGLPVVVALARAGVGRGTRTRGPATSRGASPRCAASLG